LRDLYFIQSAVTGAVKIGVSKHPSKRLRQLQTGSPHLLRLILVLPEKASLERSLHSKMKRGKQTGGTEWFSHESLTELPSWIYEQLDLEEVDNWWRQ
jgi:hypothetical protein